VPVAARPRVYALAFLRHADAGAGRIAAALEVLGESTS
jgi:hypothetical protein